MQFWVSVRSVFLSVVIIALAACQAPAELRGTPLPLETPSASTPQALPAVTPTTQVELPKTSPGTPLLQSTLSAITTPPEANLYSLAQRLKLKGVAPPRVVNPEPVSVPQGSNRVFWVTDLDKNLTFRAAATLRYVTPHAYMWVEDGLSISQESIEASAKKFEAEVYPVVTRAFGSEWTPGVDNDPHLYIVHARIPQVSGYYSSQDEYPKAISEYSNEVEVIYINVNALRPNTDRYFAVLAHELQHAIHWNMDPTEEAWVNEGLSELATQIAGYLVEFPRSFYPQPDTQLNTWPDNPRATAPHYGATYLFMDYLAQHYGGYERIKELMAEPADGIEGIQKWLAKGGYKDSFQDVFGKWVIANLLGEPGGPYGYNNQRDTIRNPSLVTGDGTLNGRASQFGANYYELRLKGDVRISFQGTPQVKVIPNDAASGTFQWWSNMGDDIDSTLTREFNLSGLSKATLIFKTWFEIEKDWDYAYAEVSQDNGKTWVILQSSLTSSANPLGSSFGPGYTGNSGGKDAPAWVAEKLDLTPYVGGKVLVRFEYVTDGAVNNNGFAIDDISLPEIGYTSDFEVDDGGWSAEGFVRINNVLLQPYLVQIVEVGDTTTVRKLSLDEAQQGSTIIRELGSQLKRAVVVVSGVSPYTTQKAPYTLVVDSAQP